MTKARGPLHRVHFRRRRENKTDYVQRLALLKSGSPRLAVRKTNKSVLAQFIAFDEKGDKTLASACSADLRKQGFPGKCNTPSAYLAGFLAGKRALAKGVKKFVLDIGLNKASKGGVVFAALKGAVDAGLETGFSQDVLPSKERMEGRHLKPEQATAFAQCLDKLKGRVDD